MTAPERIWAWRFITPNVLPEIKGGWTDEYDRRETEYILHTRAALAASPLVQEIVAEAVQWQPIETAPKDGTYHVRGLWVHSSKTGERLYWESIAGYVADDGDFVDHDSNAPWRAEDYTHWMPLPAPPAAIRARGDAKPQEKGE